MIVCPVCQTIPDQDRSPVVMHFSGGTEGSPGSFRMAPCGCRRLRVGEARAVFVMKVKNIVRRMAEVHWRNGATLWRAAMSGMLEEEHHGDVEGAVRELGREAAARAVLDT